MSDLSKKESAAAKTLDYQGVDPQIAQKLRTHRENMQATYGGLVSIFTTLGIGIHVLVVEHHSLRLMLIIGLLIYGTLAVIALYRYRRHQSSFFARGVLLGIGIGLFLAGLFYLYAKF